MDGQSHIVVINHPKRWVPGIHLEIRDSGDTVGYPHARKTKFNPYLTQYINVNSKMNHRPKWKNQNYKTSRKNFCDLRAKNS